MKYSKKKSKRKRFSKGSNRPNFARPSTPFMGYGGGGGSGSAMIYNALPFGMGSPLGFSAVSSPDAASLKTRLGPGVPKRKRDVVSDDIDLNRKEDPENDKNKPENPEKGAEKNKPQEDNSNFDPFGQKSRKDETIKLLPNSQQINQNQPASIILPRGWDDLSPKGDTLRITNGEEPLRITNGEEPYRITNGEDALRITNGHENTAEPSSSIFSKGMRAIYSWIGSGIKGKIGDKDRVDVNHRITYPGYENTNDVRNFNPRDPDNSGGQIIALNQRSLDSDDATKKLRNSRVKVHAGRDIFLPGAGTIHDDSRNETPLDSRNSRGSFLPVGSSIYDGSNPYLIGEDVIELDGPGQMVPFGETKKTPSSGYISFRKTGVDDSLIKQDDSSGNNLRGSTDKTFFDHATDSIGKVLNHPSTINAMAQSIQYFAGNQYNVYNQHENVPVLGMVG